MAQGSGRGRRGPPVGDRPLTLAGGPPAGAPWPVAWGLALAAGTRRATPAVLVGGAPLRVVRITAAGARVLDRWLAGGAVGGSGGEPALARRLTDSGVAVPAVPARPVAAADGVTIVIPVHDRPDGLLATLRALDPLLEAAPGVAVVVVDDGSSDAGGVPAAVERSGVSATTVRRSRRGGPAAARNSGWRAAGGRVVAFLDADCVPEPGWLDTLVPHLDDESVGAVAPRVVAGAAALPGPGATPGGRCGSWVERYEAARSPLDLGALPAPVRPWGRVTYVPSAALVVRRAALQAAGGFDETLRFGEDVDLVWRLVAAGWRLHYEPRARVQHPSRPSLLSALRQRHDYGTSAAGLEARHGSAVAPLALPWPNGLAWAAVTAAPAGVAALAAASALGWSTRRLRHRTALPCAEAARLALTGHLAGGRAFAEALRRAWWPLVLVGAATTRRRRSRLLAVALGPLLVEWWRAGRPLDPLRWVLLRSADDIAYGSGVWTGCIQARSARALLPRVIR